MGKLMPAHKDQIKSMINKDRKEPEDVIDFFKDNYKINLSKKKIEKICADEPLRVAHYSNKQRQKRQYKKLAEPGKQYVESIAIKPIKAGDAVKTVSEFDMLIRKAFEIHKKEFLSKVERLVDTDEITITVH